MLGADDLAAVSVILEVLTALGESGAPHRPVEVLFSAAEEAYCVGASAFDFQKIRSREAYVLDYDGALGEAVTAAPTILEFTAEILGRASHAGFAPERGVSAIVTAARAVSAVKSGRVGGETTLNFGLTEGGTATNIVPDRCVVRGGDPQRQPPAGSGDGGPGAGGLCGGLRGDRRPPEFYGAVLPHGLSGAGGRPGGPTVLPGLPGQGI